MHSVPTDVQDGSDLLVFHAQRKQGEDFGFALGEAHQRRGYRVWAALVRHYGCLSFYQLMVRLNLAQLVL